MWEAIPQLLYRWNGMLLHLLSFTCVASRDVTFRGSQRSTISSHNTLYIIYNSDVFYTKVPYLYSYWVRFPTHSPSNQQLSTHIQSKIIPVTQTQTQMYAYVYTSLHFILWIIILSFLYYISRQKLFFFLCSLSKFYQLCNKLVITFFRSDWNWMP